MKTWCSSALISWSISVDGSGTPSGWSSIESPMWKYPQLPSHLRYGTKGGRGEGPVKNGPGLFVITLS